LVDKKTISKNPKILLIRPPFLEIEGSRGYSMDIPLGLLYIAAILESHNCSVKVWDARVEGKNIFSKQKFSNGHLIGASWVEIAEYIKNESPDIVGISCQFTTQFHTAVKTSEIAKKINPGIVTVVGGPHASVMPESFLNHSKFIDFAVVGEGEYTLLEIAKWYRGRRSLESIKGIAYRNGEGISHNEPRNPIKNLDDLPFPAYHLIDMERYFDLKAKGGNSDVSRPRYNYPGSERSISFITSRGCPFNCVFCSIHLHMGKKWRPHSADYVVRHLEYLIKNYNIKHIHFEDDNLTLEKKRFNKILNGIKEKHLSFTWDTPNGVRADTLDKSLLVKCKQVGCTYLIIAIESGDQYVLDNIIKKKLSLKKVIKVCEMAKEIGIDMRSFYVIGFPGETNEDMKKTIDLALNLQKKYRIWPNLMVAKPLLGTSLYKQCHKEGFLVKPVDSITLAPLTDGNSLIKTGDFDPDDIAWLQQYFNNGHRRIHYINFLKSLMQTPTFIAYIILNSFKDFRRVKEFCADTVLFGNYVRRHFPNTNAG
jgi:radical SAM superfamily enzyme YgiQ (UPF0313 family)